MKRLGLLLLCASCDIFHSTDFPTKCSDGGCVESGVNDAGVTPFTTDSAKALDYAKSTCAWLAACEGPLGENATGRCLANAVLAFDRTINPNRPPKNQSLTTWQCLFDAATARSCAAVWTCTPPAGGVMCPSNPLVGCFQGSRIDCRKPGEYAQRQNCASSGQTCGAQNGNINAICAGAQGQTCGTDGGGSGCSGTSLSVCDDAGVDLGRDCASVGAGACTEVLDAGACKPEASGTCMQTQLVTCDANGVAHGCITGVPEVVDCKALAGGCVDGQMLAPHLPPSNVCFHMGPGSCGDDVCGGSGINACLRGKPIAIDCMALGLKPCMNIATTPDGPRPACGKP